MHDSLFAATADAMLEDRPIGRELCFYNPPSNGSSPRYETDDPALKGTRNYSHCRVVTDIHNARGHEKDFKLSVHGFVLHQGLDTSNIDFTSSKAIKELYLPLTKETIATYIPHLVKIVPFDITTRDASAQGRINRPVRKVHIDQSRHGAYLRAEHELSGMPELLDDVMKSRVRYRIVNVWSPINRVVKDHPLVFADSRTIADSDLLPVAQIYPHYAGETLAVKYNVAQKFWYWKDMNTTEAIVFQIFDSEGELNDNGNLYSARCVHASFCLSECGEESMTRESIEVRCIVLTSK